MTPDSHPLDAATGIVFGVLLMLGIYLVLAGVVWLAVTSST